MDRYLWNAIANFRRSIALMNDVVSLKRAWFATSWIGFHPFFKDSAFALNSIWIIRSHFHYSFGNFSSCYLWEKFQSFFRINNSGISWNKSTNDDTDRAKKRYGTRKLSVLDIISIESFSTFLNIPYLAVSAHFMLKIHFKNFHLEKLPSISCFGMSNAMCIIALKIGGALFI